jgi:hypothetical protein
MCRFYLVITEMSAENSAENPSSSHVSAHKSPTDSPLPITALQGHCASAALLNIARSQLEVFWENGLMVEA